MSKALVIVDVQKEFDEYIQHDLVDALSEYAEKFDTVYQIWDTHNDSVAPTHSFPGQIDSVPKKFGKKHFSKEVQEYIKNLEASSTEGRTFKLSNDGYVVRVKNNHDWFYVNPEIVKLIKELKGRKVILAGGADGECLEDIYQAFLAFGLNTHINKKYTYNAKTTQEDSVEEKLLIPPPPPGYNINEGRTAETADEICIRIDNSEQGYKLQEIAIEYFGHNRFMEFATKFPCYIFIDIKNGGTSWLPPNLNNKYLLDNNPEILPDVDLFKDVYMRIFNMNDLFIIKKMLSTKKIIQRINYNPKHFIRENKLY